MGQASWPRTPIKNPDLNLKNPEGKKIFLKLAETADVVVENFRPDVMKRLGIGYPVLCAAKSPDYLLRHLGFRATGPDAMKPAYDQIIQGLSGVMAINATRD